MAEVKAKVEVTLQVPPVPCALEVLDNRALDPHSISLKELSEDTLRAVGAAWTEKLLAEATKQREKAGLIKEALESPTIGENHEPAGKPRKPRSRN